MDYFNVFFALILDYYSVIDHFCIAHNTTLSSISLGMTVIHGVN